MKKFVVVGDSHSMYFVQFNKLTPLIDTHWSAQDYKVADISSASIRGLGKERSTLGLRDRITDLIQECQPEYMVFGFGQVDTELGYYYRTIIKGEDISADEFIAETIVTYRQYLKNYIIDKHNLRVIIKGLNPTVLISDVFAGNYIGNITTQTITNPEEKTKLKQKVKDELSDYAFRYQFNQKVNDELKKLAVELNGEYFDIWDKVMNEDTGMIDIQYLPAGFDHHLADNVAVRQIHYDALYEVMSKLA